MAQLSLRQRKWWQPAFLMEPKEMPQARLRIRVDESEVTGNHVNKSYLARLKPETTSCSKVTRFGRARGMSGGRISRGVFGFWDVSAMRFRGKRSDASLCQGGGCAGMAWGKRWFVNGKIWGADFGNRGASRIFARLARKGEGLWGRPDRGDFGPGDGCAAPLEDGPRETGRLAARSTCES